jgi:hypothetical protein
MEPEGLLLFLQDCVLSQLNQVHAFISCFRCQPTHLYPKPHVASTLITIMHWMCTIIIHPVVFFPVSKCYMWDVHWTSEGSCMQYLCEKWFCKETKEESSTDFLICGSIISCSIITVLLCREKCDKNPTRMMAVLAEPASSVGWNYDIFQNNGFICVTFCV